MGAGLGAPGSDLSARARAACLIVRETEVGLPNGITQVSRPMKMERVRLMGVTNEIQSLIVP